MNLEIVLVTSVVKGKGQDSSVLSQHSGFTLVELLVACVVTVTCLLGVYAVFQHAMDVEATAAARWHDYSAADAVAKHLSEVVECAINLSEIPAIVGGRSGDDGEGFMECTLAGVECPSGGSGRSGVQRRRYSWNSSSEEKGRTGTLRLQMISYAGTKPLTPGAEIDQENESRLWDRVETTVIGKSLKSVVIQYKPLRDPNAGWGNRWRGPVGDAAIRIRVSVGSQTAEYIVVPRVNAGVIISD